MKLDGVELINRDPIITARRVRIKTAKLPNHETITPLRGLSSTESNHREKLVAPLHLDEPLENTVFEVIGQFTNKTLAELRQKNGAFDIRMKQYRSHRRHYEEMITKFFPKITGTQQLEIQDIRSLVDLQLESGFDIIAIPEPRGDAVRFDQVVGRFSDYISAKGAEPMPYVDMQNDPEVFRQKIKTVASHLPNIKCLGLVHRSYSIYYPNFRAVGDELGDKEIWVHQSNVPRMHSQTIPLAEMHFPQAHSIDSTTLESRRVVTTFSVKPVQRIRKFVEKTLGEVRLQDIHNHVEPDSDCTCPACTNISNVKKPLDIDRAVKIHETFCSTKEFESGREAIRQKDMATYIQSRKYLNQALSQPLA